MVVCSMSLSGSFRGIGTYLGVRVQGGKVSVGQLSVAGIATPP